MWFEVCGARSVVRWHSIHAGGRRQTAEGRGQTADGRRQTADGRGQRANDKRHMTRVARAGPDRQAIGVTSSRRTTIARHSPFAIRHSPFAILDPTAARPRRAPCLQNNVIATSCPNSAARARCRSRSS
ncbi:transcriptional regulator, DeoR family domain protein [Burkholderia sp. ABCPW 111]|nr:transcriptional regulator, DeoR family domain protein [Burkholderia sp. ABCPW 111]